MTMNKTMIYKKNVTLIVLLLSLLISSGLAMAQDRIPREYTNPDEVISFDRQTAFQDAVEILNMFAQDYDNRFIIDRTGYTGNIGLTLPPMHWKDALNYILRVQNMSLQEEPELYEILTYQQLEERDRPVSEMTGPGRVLTDQVATTKTREVRINATFFEGNRRALREIGVDWSTLTRNVPGNLSDFVTEQGTGQIPSQFDNRFVSVNAAGAQSVSQNVFNSLINFGNIGSGIEVQALFSAFEADNLGEVLATPSVKVMDREQGRIQVGEDFSIKQRDFAGNVTDQFFSTGTILTVTPQIVEYQDTTFIHLILEVERSSAQPDPVSTVISKEEASTHTLLLNGESTVIAGLYRTDRSEVRRGIPILKDLPPWFFGLRYLFGFNSTDISQTELIVLVQAELEESIPNRMARELLTKRNLLELQQARHREELDYVSAEAFGSSFFDEPSLIDTSGPDPEAAAEPEPAEVPVPAEAEPEPSPEPEVEKPEANEITEEENKLKVSPAEVNRRDLDRYAGEYRAMEMENLDENHANLLFYTIGGSFRERENARSLFRTFRQQGYEAHILYNPRSSFYFVAYAGFEDLEEAVIYTRQIQSDVQTEAWLSTIMSEERLRWNNNNNNNNPGR